MNETNFIDGRLDRAIKTLSAQRARLEGIEPQHPSVNSVAHELRIAASELMVAAICLQSQQRAAAHPHPLFTT
ncbi:hypothetical protein AB7M17_005573 [Bradyrhizobium sp. USDA 377]